jgi:hypothetical protein
MMVILFFIRYEVITFVGQKISWLYVQAEHVIVKSMVAKPPWYDDIQERLSPHSVPYILCRTLESIARLSCQLTHCRKFLSFNKTKNICNSIDQWLATAGF